MNKRRVFLVFGVPVLVLAILGLLCAAWWWGLPWFAVQRLNADHPALDTLWVERVWDRHFVSAVVVILEDDVPGEEMLSFVEDVNRYGVLMLGRNGGYTSLLFLVTLAGDDQYYALGIVQCPQNKTGWEDGAGCRSASLWGIPISPESLRE